MFTGFFRGVASMGAPTIFEKVCPLIHLTYKICYYRLDYVVLIKEIMSLLMKII